MGVSSFQRVLCFVQVSMELSWGLNMCPIREVSSIGTKQNCIDYSSVHRPNTETHSERTSFSRCVDPYYVYI